MRYLLMIWMLVPLSLWAQEAEEEPKLTVGGYVKDMATFNFAGKDSTLVDNLIHNRINLAWYPTKNLTGKLEFRNRVFFGDLVKLFQPYYGDFIDVNNDYFDLSWLPVNNKDLVIHTMIDRFYFEWNKDDWEVSLGRQRINWGMNLAWNPNDLFNAYSFFDFDYEERPGSDALRIRKYTGYASEIDFAIKAADRFEDLTTAMKYQINKWNYDIQFIGGLMKNNVTLGTGWAGNLWNAGFKGEMTYLRSLDETIDNGFLASVSIDYLFANSLYLNASGLYNSYGKESPNIFLVNTSSNLDIRSVSPYNWSTFVQGSYPVHPLVNTGLSAIFFPSDGSVFINPFVTYSIASNLDLDFISQLFLSEGMGDNYKAQSKLFYLRLKFSY
ncbi:MAG: hypothetical protein ACFHWX_07365 [Bacteroidota bacterium]